MNIYIYNVYEIKKGMHIYLYSLTFVLRVLVHDDWEGENCLTYFISFYPYNKAMGISPEFYSQLHYWVIVG